MRARPTSLPAITHAQNRAGATSSKKCVRGTTIGAAGDVFFKMASFLMRMPIGEYSPMGRYQFAPDIAGVPQKSCQGLLLGSRSYRRQSRVMPFDPKYICFGAADFYGIPASIYASNGPKCPKNCANRFSRTTRGMKMAAGQAKNGCGDADPLVLPLYIFFFKSPICAQEHKMHI